MLISNPFSNDGQTEASFKGTFASKRFEVNLFNCKNGNFPCDNFEETANTISSIIIPIFIIIIQIPQVVKIQLGA